MIWAAFVSLAVSLDTSCKAATFLGVTGSIEGSTAASAMGSNSLYQLAVPPVTTGRYVVVALVSIRRRPELRAMEVRKTGSTMRSRIVSIENKSAEVIAAMGLLRC